MNTYVSRQLAELAKEKGFEQKHDVGVVCRITNKVNSSFERTRPITESDIENSWCVFNEIYPTIADVVMWLYEEHGIWICADRHYDSFIVKRDRIPIDFDGKASFHYTSPTKAYEAGLEHTLKTL